MRALVKNTLAELMTQRLAEPAPTAPTLPAPRGNRHTRRNQQATLVSVQKQLRKQGINMEMGKPTPQPPPKKREPVAVENKSDHIRGRSTLPAKEPKPGQRGPSPYLIVTDEMEEMVEDFKKESGQFVGVDMAIGPDRTVVQEIDTTLEEFAGHLKKHL